MFDPAKIAELEAKRQAWEAAIERDGKERPGPFMTVSSRPVARLYGPEDLAR